jgi:mono/diheme cytochrome c family protein
MNLKMAAAAVLCSLLLVATASASFADGSAAGQKYYLRYCAACHGAKGDGLGPAAGSLIVHPPDLRRLYEKYGTPLPSRRLERYIDGRDMVAAHGSRTMPIWGKRFPEIWKAKNSTQSDMDDQLKAIVDYLDTIQLAGSEAGSGNGAERDNRDRMDLKHP